MGESVVVTMSLLTDSFSFVRMKQRLQRLSCAVQGVFMALLSLEVKQCRSEGETVMEMSLVNIFYTDCFLNNNKITVEECQTLQQCYNYCQFTPCQY